MLRRKKQSRQQSDASSGASSGRDAVDRFARAVSIFSLITSIAAVVIPYWQFWEERKETLVHQINPRGGRGSLRLTGSGVLQVPWGLNLSNTSNRKISIMDYSITTGDEPGRRWYSDIEGGLFDNDGKQVELPIYLDSGESKKLQIYVGITISTEVKKIIRPLLESGMTTMFEILPALARQGIDLYGNKVDFEEMPGGGWRISQLEQDSPIFWFKFVTGRNTEFISMATTFERR